MAMVGPTAETGSLLDRLDDGKVISLGVLSGAELCALGATEHPVCWGALRGAWWKLDQKERAHFVETSALSLLHRDLITDKPPGRGGAALPAATAYQLSAELGVLLGARMSPALIIATHHVPCAFAARELARWACKPIPVARYQPTAPRLIGFFGGADGDRPSSYQLNIHADGGVAHVDGPDISADLGREELTRLLCDIITTWDVARAF